MTTRCVTPSASGALRTWGLPDKRATGALQIPVLTKRERQVRLRFACFVDSSTEAPMKNQPIVTPLARFDATGLIG